MKQITLDSNELELILDWARSEAEGIQEGSIFWPDNTQTLADCERIIAKLTI